MTTRLPRFPHGLRRRKPRTAILVHFSTSDVHRFGVKAAHTLQLMPFRQANLDLPTAAYQCPYRTKQSNMINRYSVAVYGSSYYAGNTDNRPASNQGWGLK